MSREVWTSGLNDEELASLRKQFPDDRKFKIQVRKAVARRFQEVRAGTGKKQKEHELIGDLNPISRLEERVNKRTPRRRERHAIGLNHLVRQSSEFQQEVATAASNAAGVAEVRGARIDAALARPPKRVDVVIDTSALLRGLTGDADAEKVLELVQTRRIRADVIPHILDEYQRILNLDRVSEGPLTPKRKKRAQAIIDQMRDVSRGKAVEISPGAVTDDETDSMFVAAARLAGTGIPIITVDKHFDSSPKDVVVISPKQFLEQIVPTALLGVRHSKKS